MTEPHNNQEVAVALDLLNTTLGEENDRIFSAGAQAMEQQDSKTAWAVLEFAEKLKGVRGEVEKLIATWTELQNLRDKATPAVQKIVNGEGRLFSGRTRVVKKSFTRTIDHPLAPKTNFSVEFPDGTLIQEAMAWQVLVKTIEKIGVEKVEALNLRINGEPLIDKKVSEKYPRSSKRIGKDYYLQTLSNTKTKIKYLNTIKKMLSLSYKIVE